MISVTFRETRRWIDMPVRTCKSTLGSCAVCKAGIVAGQRYFDGGKTKRAHEACVDVEAEKAARDREQAKLGVIVRALVDR